MKIGTYSVAHFTFYLNCSDKTLIEQYIKWFGVLVEVSFIVESVAHTSHIDADRTLQGQGSLLTI